MNDAYLTGALWAALAGLGFSKFQAFIPDPGDIIHGKNISER